MAKPSDRDLTEKRNELEKKLQALAEKVVGTGHPEAPGVSVEVGEPARMDELPGAHPIMRTYDTIARIAVHDEDSEKAAKFARGIAETLDTEWAELQFGPAHIAAGSKPSEIEARFALAD
jgi:hypothetical protein